MKTRAQGNTQFSGPHRKTPSRMAGFHRAVKGRVSIGMRRTVARSPSFGGEPITSFQCFMGEEGGQFEGRFSQLCEKPGATGGQKATLGGRILRPPSIPPPRPHAWGWLAATKCRNTEKGGILGRLHPLPLWPSQCAAGKRDQAGATFTEMEPSIRCHFGPAERAGSGRIMAAAVLFGLRTAGVGVSWLNRARDA